MSELLRKAIDCEFKVADEAADGSFELYAAVFNNVDRGGDVIQPGAFANLAEFVADGVGLVGHDMKGLPVAWIESAVQDARGLRIKGRFHSDPESQRVRTIVLERMAAGKSVKCSIGYQVIDGASEQANGRAIYRLKKINVYEFSFVNIPMNPLAGVVAAKSADAGAEGRETVEKPTVWESVKEWLGLNVKAGRAMSKANHAAFKSFADQCLAHGDEAAKQGDELVARGKAMVKHAAGYKAIGDAMHKHLAAFDPGREPDDDAPDEKAAADVETKDAGDDQGDDALELLKLQAFAAGLAFPPAD